MTTNTPTAPETPGGAAGTGTGTPDTPGEPSDSSTPAAAAPAAEAATGEDSPGGRTAAGPAPAPPGDWAPPSGQPSTPPGEPGHEQQPTAGAPPAPPGDWAPPSGQPSSPSGEAGHEPAGRAPAGASTPSADDWTPAAAPGEGEGAGDDRPNGRDPTDTAGDTGAGDASAGDASEHDHDDGSTTVVLGGVGTAAQSPSPAPRLSADPGGAPTGTRTTDPHGMRALRARITPPAGIPRVGDGDAEPAPRHLRTTAEGARRRSLVLAAAPVLIVVLFLLGWAIDSAALSGQVMRNVEVAGRPVGGLGQASLPEVMAEVAEDAASRPVHVVNGDRTYETTAGAIGLTVDEEATADAALDAGRDDSIFVRPFKWLGSFFGSRDVPVDYTVSEGAAALTLAQLQGEDATAPVDPEVFLDPETGEFQVRPGRPGDGIDARAVAAELPDAAEEAESGPIVVQAESTDVQPQYSDQAAIELVAAANEMTANGLTLRVEDTTVEVSPAQLRTWIGQAPPDQGFELAPNGDRMREELPALFTGLSEPEDATITLGANGRPEIEPGRDGITCCQDDSAERIWNALNAREAEVALEAQVAEPETTTEEAEAWQVREPVGGSRAWRSGGEVPGPRPGFTTFYDPGQARVTNIHRIAELVRGAVIPPDGTFSVNEHVGQRTPENGFVAAGAIRNGRHVDEVGGGVSQFATTMFNAAYFAGLDIPEYQAHTEYFSRYPRGREATMGFPNPDLRIHNNTPYGILIWTTVTDDSVTVTLYSTPHVEASQTGISESAAGVGCTSVVTTRTRRFLDDGHTETDTFRATYRNEEGINCQGEPIPPDPSEDPAG